MSIVAINVVKKILSDGSCDLPPRPRLVLMLIADHAGKDGTCFPGRRKLAEMAGCSEASLKRDLADLERRNHIKRHVRHTTNGAQSANLIEIVGIGGLTGNPGEAHSCEPGEALSHEPGAGSMVIQAYKDEPPLEPSIKPSVVAIAAAKPDEIDTGELHRKLLAAANGALNPLAKGTGLICVAEPIGWIQQGADIDLDIVPAVAAVAHRVQPGSIRAWSYFRGAVSDAKAARERGLPPPNAMPRAPSKPSHMRRYG